MLCAWAARTSFGHALPTCLYVACELPAENAEKILRKCSLNVTTEALAESTPLPQRGESTSLPLARKQRRWGGEGGHTAKQKRIQKAFSTALDDDGSRRDTHMLVPAPLVCLVLCRLDELHAPRRPHLPLPRADPHALTPRRAALF